MREQMLSEEQWLHIQPLLPKRRSKGRPWADDRLVFEGILWVLRTGARWRDLPDPYLRALAENKSVLLMARDME